MRSRVAHEPVARTRICLAHLDLELIDWGRRIAALPWIEGQWKR